MEIYSEIIIGLLYNLSYDDYTERGIVNNQTYSNVCVVCQNKKRRGGFVC